MPFTVKITEAVYEGSTSYTTDKSWSVGSVAKLEETVADAVTDQEHTIGIDFSALKAFYMVSDQAVTVETNNGTTPDDTFALTANHPVVWKEGDAAIFTVDVTSVFLTNSSGSTATVKIVAAVDS